MQRGAASDTTSSTTRTLVDDGKVYVRSDGNTAVIEHFGATASKPYPKIRAGMVLACPPDLAGQVIDTIDQHIENGNSFCRSPFSSAVGANVVGLISIDTGFNRKEVPEVPEAMKDFARTKRPDWDGKCGCNVDWVELHHTPIPDGMQLVSGVELPTPEREYPKLDVLGCAAKVKVMANLPYCVYRALQQRAVVECGIAIHIDFIRAGTLAAGGGSSVSGAKQSPIDVLFLSVDLPTNAEMLDLTMDDDMRQRLQSYYIDTPLPERMAYVAIVPPGFELGAGADAPERDQLLPHNPNPDIMITCRTCRVAFKHTYAEQRQYEEEHFPPPTQCAKCGDRFVNCGVCEEPILFPRFNQLKYEHSPPRRHYRCKNPGSFGK